MKIAVLIPCYNEELTIGKVVRDFKQELPGADIYVYDNNSSDNTIPIAKEEGAIIRNEPRQGKGNVVRRMFREVDADVYVMIDGDDTYPASAVHELIAPVTEGRADIVVGDRLTNGTYEKENDRLFHSFGNSLVRNLINGLFQSNLKDIMSGYRAFNKHFVKNSPLLSSGFEIETEMTLHAVEKGFLIQEIPIQYQDRPEGSFSKLNTIRDGLRVLRMISQLFKHYKPLAFFSWITFFLFSCGLFSGYIVIIEFFQTGEVPKFPRAILATGFMILSAISFTSGLLLDSIVRLHRETYELWLKRKE